MRSEAARLWYTYRMKAVLFSAYKRRGMTLTEVLIAVGVIGVLASVVLVTVNPKQNLEDADDVKRQQDLRVMIDALYQYQIDHGTFPVVQNVYTIDVTHRDICTVTAGNIFFCTFSNPVRLPLGPLIPDYLAKLPYDPANNEEYETGYRLWLDESGRIHAFAPLGDDGKGIEIAR